MDMNSGSPVTINLKFVVQSPLIAIKLCVQGSNGSSKGMSGRGACIRKEVRYLSPTELANFKIAYDKFNTVIEDAKNQLTGRQMFTYMHRYTISPCAHFGPSFLPWHREYLFR